jgi:hypothetical protein
MEPDLKILDALGSNKVDSYLWSEARRPLDDGLQPSAIWFSVVLRLTSEDHPEFPNEITRIENHVAVRINLAQLPDLVANPNIESIEASRPGGTL